MVESDRPAIFQYITNRFGNDKAARVASFGTMQDKGVIDVVGKGLSERWERVNGKSSDNPWSTSKISEIKKEFCANPDKAKEKYPEIFYYYEGLNDVKISQSVHPAGMVISPITLDDNFGVFDKDGERCMMLDMDRVHDHTGLAKYDFLNLKTVKVIRDTCNYLNQMYPKTHEVNWDDENVWKDMSKNLNLIFQFESVFASDCFKKFSPESIFDMSLVTACIRPSGTSYRDELLKRKPHSNPSEIIDELLKDNLGYLIYQEDTIKFLQQICGLSGSEADNIRRAIGRKQKERLDAALPSILEGYCRKSNKPREEAEHEAREFLQIIEDSASYQFGYNHSIAYCLLGYLCGYYRYYYPLEFLTSFLNNAANDTDIKNGTDYATRLGIKVTMPKWGVSRGEYFFNKDKNVIAKGLASVKYMSAEIADELYYLSKEKEYQCFMDLLKDLNEKTSVDARHIDVLIKIDFFSDFGNQRELFKIVDVFNSFKKGETKKIKKELIDGTALEPIVKKYSVGITKSGGDAKSYTLLDVMSILRESESVIKAYHVPDLDDLIKVQNFKDVMGYIGYTSGKEEDRRKLYVTEIKPLCKKSNGVQFGYSVFTKSIGSGVESRFTVFNRLYNQNPIKSGDIIFCKGFTTDKSYFQLTAYEKLA